MSGNSSAWTTTGEGVGQFGLTLTSCWQWKSNINHPSTQTSHWQGSLQAILVHGIRAMEEYHWRHDCGLVNHDVLPSSPA